MVSILRTQGTNGCLTIGSALGDIICLKLNHCTDYGVYGSQINETDK